MLFLRPDFFKKNTSFLDVVEKQVILHSFMQIGQTDSFSTNEA